MNTQSSATLTNLERKMLRDAAEFVLAGEWPWEPEKSSEREALESASNKVISGLPAGALLAMSESASQAKASLGAEPAKWIPGKSVPSKEFQSAVSAWLEKWGDLAQWRIADLADRLYTPTVDLPAATQGGEDVIVVNRGDSIAVMADSKTVIEVFSRYEGREASYFARDYNKALRPPSEHLD